MYKIFLAEDEIIVREGIRNSLKRERTPYVLAGEASDGEIALSMIGDTKPDILITDIKMPFMDGLTLSRKIKKNFPWIKIIILSGHDEFQYAREAISIGVEEYLLKPVSSSELLKALDKVAKRIDEEKEESLGIENLKTRLQSYSQALKILDSELSRETAAAAENDVSFNPASLVNISSDVFFSGLLYADKKDIDSVVEGYIATAGSSWNENPMVAFYLLAEIIVASSKAAEALGADIMQIIPFNLSYRSIQEIAGSPVIFSQKVKALLLSLIEFRDSHSGGRNQSAIMKAKEYIESNFGSSDISLDSTASYAGVSPNHLSMLFPRETGEQFIRYLTRIRIDRAKLLLKSTAMKNTAIANETGFIDPHYFSSIFKKTTGFSPKEFRRREQSGN